MTHPGGFYSAFDSESTSASGSQSTVVYESVSGTLSASDSESSVSDSVIESMSAAQSYLQSESAAPEGSGQSRIGSLLASLNIFGKRK